MRQATVGIALCTVLLLAAASSASAAPDPGANKNAILVDLDCGGYSVVTTGILQSHSPSFHVVFSEPPDIGAGSTARRSATTRGTTPAGWVIRSRPSASLDSLEPRRMAKS